MGDFRNTIKFRATVRFEDKDQGMKDLVSKINEMQRGEVFVGVTAEAGTHLNSKEGLSVLDIATIQEFGLGVPERSFIRAWQAGYEATAKNLERQEWTKVIAREQTAHQALQILGKRFLFDCRANFLSFPFTANAPSTVKRKGFDKPLIETGQLYSSLTYRIMLGGSSTGDQTYTIQYKD